MNRWKKIILAIIILLTLGCAGFYTYLVFRFPFTYEMGQDVVRVVEYRGLKKDVVIPDTIDGLPVTDLEPRMFMGNELIESLVIPDCIDYLDGDAFANCSNLVTVKLPENLSMIRVGTFSGCRKLREVKIPSCVEAINEYAFYGCTGLMRVEIPASVRRIGREAFPMDAEDLVLVVSPGSEGERYAKGYNFVYVYE